MHVRTVKKQILQMIWSSENCIVQKNHLKKVKNSKNEMSKNKVKFRYSERATKMWKNLPISLTSLSIAKKLGDFFQIFVAFSEYLNFTFLLKKLTWSFNFLWICESGKIFKNLFDEYELLVTYSESGPKKHKSVQVRKYITQNSLNQPWLWRRRKKWH